MEVATLLRSHTFYVRSFLCERNEEIESSGDSAPCICDLSIRRSSLLG